MVAFIRILLRMRLIMMHRITTGVTIMCASIMRISRIKRLRGIIIGMLIW